MYRECRSDTVSFRVVFGSISLLYYTMYIVYVMYVVYGTANEGNGPFDSYYL